MQKVLSLPKSWKKRIKSSIAKRKKFYFAISNLNRMSIFYAPSKDCGKLFNTAIHAFADCPGLFIMKEFISLNISGLRDKFVTLLPLLGVTSNVANTPTKTCVLEFALSSRKSRIAGMLTEGKPVRKE
uniref:Uncharacterized protein n=1 Tax=Lepeophtheirus salmonis TaxID=72036 RepID=A0A0K2T4D8_LEPSM